MQPKAAKSCAPAGVTNKRALEAFGIRFRTASEEAEVAVPPHPTNGDEERYKDKCGTYSKCIKQAGRGLVDQDAFKKFRAALGSVDGKIPGSADFESVPLGGNRPLNGPLAAFAFTLAGTDSEQFGAPLVPKAPALASKEYATELVELYWASLLRDVPFTGYETNQTAIDAARELSGLAAYAGPRDEQGLVTPRLLFRGGGKFGDPNGHEKEWFQGESIGPYISQFCIQPTNLGAQSIDQRMQTSAPNVDYMTDWVTWQAVQNGQSTGLQLQPGDTNPYLHDGRGLSTFTHQDELFQAYFIAYLVMNTLGIPKNPKNPYASFTHQQPFGTFGGPDISATLAAAARAALNAVWYQKWIVHLRHRPESGGGIVEMMKTGKHGVEGQLDKVVLESNAVDRSFQKHGSHFLSQAFPEGSPAHPAYPTGHGTVAGACITVLKFFYDGKALVPNPKVPSHDGLSLGPYAYAGQDAGLMTVNGELHKLAHNISFGHGIHAGIHWRSDTDYSIRLGEAVALSFLRDQALTYRETVSVDLTTVDGSTVTISN